MSAAANEYGNCYVGVHARFIGVQPVKVQGVGAGASRSGHEHLAVTFGRALFYLEDRDAFESFRAAFQRAERLADRVLGPVQDAFTEAEQTEADWIAKTGGVKPCTPKALTAEEIRSALVLHDQGLDPDTIAGRLGLDKGKIARILNRPPT